MANKNQNIDPNRQRTPQQQQGGLEQEETGGPGAREKNRNQQEDGQFEQGRENNSDHQRR
jgi:hypothetical protein